MTYVLSTYQIILHNMKYNINSQSIAIECVFKNELLWRLCILVNRSKIWKNFWSAANTTIRKKEWRVLNSNIEGNEEGELGFVELKGSSVVDCAILNTMTKEKRKEIHRRKQSGIKSSANNNRTVQIY